jgi:hypothetical protein
LFITIIKKSNYISSKNILLGTVNKIILVYKVKNKDKDKDKVKDKDKDKDKDNPQESNLEITYKS